MRETCNLLKNSVLIITESKLDETITTNRILLPGFHEPVRRDRIIDGKSTRSGGCLIYVNELLPFEQKVNLQELMFEHIWVDIKINNIKLSINCLYRPPNHTADDHESFLLTSQNILQKLDNYQADYKIISSDLNFGNIYCKSPILTPKPLDNTAPDLFAEYGYTQLIDIPTRITNNTISLIDLFFIQSDELIICHGTLPMIADHAGTFASLDINRQQTKQKTKTIIDYNSIDIKGLEDFIKNYDFQTNVFTASEEQQTQLYTDILHEAFNKFVPTKQVQIRTAAPPWCSTPQFNYLTTLRIL